MSGNNDPILPTLLSLIICLFVFNIGIIYHNLACWLYNFSLELLPQTNLPEPHIHDSVIKMIFFELFSSPSEALQAIKSLFSISGIIFQQDLLFKSIQLFTELLSLINLYISYRYGTYALSVITSLSMILAYYQVEVLLLDYLVKLVLSLFENIIFIMALSFLITFNNNPPKVSHRYKYKA